MSYEQNQRLLREAFDATERGYRWFISTIAGAPITTALFASEQSVSDDNVKKWLTICEYVILALQAACFTRMAVHYRRANRLRKQAYGNTAQYH